MLIGINGQRLLRPNPAGPEVYTYNIINGLSKVDKKNSYRIYLTEKPSPVFWHDLCADNPNFSYKVIDKLISWTQGGLALEMISYPVDAFFTSVHTMPIIRRPGLKTVGMIHGLEYNYSKEYGHPFKKHWISKPEWFVAKFSDRLVVPSGHTKNDILSRKWGVDGSKITVIPEGVSSVYQARPSTELQNVKEKYGLNGEYLLFISTIQPRKNLPKLVEGFSMAVRKLKEAGYDHTPILAVAGKVGWDAEESLNSPEKYGVKDNVLFLGRVSDADLPLILSGAKSFISTSVEEGFGLPLLEAMASGVPAIVSDIQAYREMGRDHVWYIDPLDTGDISQKIVSMMKGEYSQDTVESARRHATNYTWEEAALKTLEVIEKA